MKNVEETVQKFAGLAAVSSFVVETADNLKGLGSQFKQMPPGWKFRTKVLDRDLTVKAPAPQRLAWVTQDEFQNTYQGCGCDAACNYKP